jgi:hypothetical protein
VIPSSTRRGGARAALAITALAALGALAALPGAAHADPLAVSLAARDGIVRATVDLAPAFPRPVEARLGNGLRNVVAVFVAVMPADGGAPTAGAGRVLEILFDVWEETWSVTIRDAGAPGGRRQTVRSGEALRQVLHHAADVELGPVASLPAQPFTVDVRLDFNPVSPELLARTREYLAGATGPGGSSRSVLGAVAGLLLREPDDEEESLLLRSAPLTAASVKP